MRVLRFSSILPTVVLLLGTARIPLPAADGPDGGQGRASQAQRDEDAARRFRFLFKDYPSLRFGKALRIDVRAMVQTDVRSFSPQLDTKEGKFDLNRARVGVQGKFLRHFEYEAEYELKSLLRPFEEDEATGTLSENWRDLYVDFTYFNDLQLKAGKFKLPFSLDQLTGHRRLDFIHRSRVGATLAPGRDIGFMLHGRLFKRGLSYEAGLFERDGENARSTSNPGAERTFAGRLTGTPFRPLPVPGVLKTAEFGIAVTSSSVPEGPKGLRGRTVANERFFPLPGDWMFVHGERLRVGTEMSWAPGPFSLKGEFIHFRDERRGQSLRGADLPDLISRGWYLSGTWIVTGEPKAPGVEPRHAFPGGGAGAIELAGRYEQIRFGSSEHPGAPLRHQRAANLLPASDRVWTLGVNWYLNRWLKLQFNGVREKIEDTVRGPIVGKDVLWARLLRLQVAM